MQTTSDTATTAHWSALASGQLRLTTSILHLDRAYYSLGYSPLQTVIVQVLSIVPVVDSTVDNFRHCYNYCPLRFMVTSGKKITPFLLKMGQRDLLQQLCDC